MREGICEGIINHKSDRKAMRKAGRLIQVSLVAREIRVWMEIGPQNMTRDV